MADTHYVHIAPSGEARRLPTIADVAMVRGEPGYVWLDLIEPSRDELSALCEPFGVHPLVVEDCLDEEQVPRFAEFPGHSFALVNRFFYREGVVAMEEVDFILGADFLITVASVAAEPVASRRQREAVAAERAAIGAGPDRLLHALLDRIVDDKLEAIEALQDDLDAAEEDVIERSALQFDPARLLKLRRSLLMVRKSLVHEREVLVRICRKDSRFITDAAILAFRDVYDHLVKFAEIVEGCREMVAGVMEIRLSLVNNELATLGNRTNLVMRRLTYVTTIFMPLSFFAGVGGMSEWSAMMGPENWRWSYPLFLVLMALVAGLSHHGLRWLERRPPSAASGFADFPRR